VTHDVPSEQLARLGVDRVGEEIADAATVVGADAPDRRQVLLAVEHESAFVDLAVEVDGKLRDAQDRAVDAEQSRLDRCTLRDRDAA
jgi:hypothetical protein